MILERLQKKLAAGKPAFGPSIRLHDPAIIELIGKRWDFVWIDLQHGTIGLDHLAGIVRACDLVGVTSLVRAPLDPWGLGLALDTDAGGVIVAQVDSADMARAAVRAAKFPPLGDRSYGGRRMVDRHGLVHTEKANRNQLLIVQIESGGAVESCEAIAGVDGVDGLMLGPDDMRLRLGIPLDGSLYDEPIAAVARRVTAACRRHGKLAMYFGGTTVDTLRQATELGFNLLSTGADSLFLVQGSMALWKVCEEFLQGA